MGTKTFTLSERISQECIFESAYKWKVEWLFGWYRRTGTGTLWKDCRADETGTWDHGTVKGRKSDGMGSENEQYTIVCKGDCG